MNSDTEASGFSSDEAPEEFSKVDSIEQTGAKFEADREYLKIKKSEDKQLKKKRQNKNIQQQEIKKRKLEELEKNKLPAEILNLANQQIEEDTLKDKKEDITSKNKRKKTKKNEDLNSFIKVQSLDKIGDNIAPMTSRGQSRRKDLVRVSSYGLRMRDKKQMAKGDTRVY